MATADPALLRVADALSNLAENSRERADRDDRDRRALLEKVDELLKLQQEERTTLAELRHQIGDDVLGAFASAFATHQAQAALASGEAASALRHSVADSLQARATEAALVAHHGDREAAGGDKRDTEKLATVGAGGIRISWDLVRASLPYLLAALTGALGYLLRHLVPPH